MASAAAQKYFGSFSPQDQEAIYASWGGADLMDRWFQNAVAAGAVPQSGAQGGRPNPSAGETFASWVRAKAKAENWSDDLGRESDAQLEAWQGNFDYNRGRFRSEHAPEGATGDWVYVDKPSESVRDPEGTEWGPWGNQVGVNVTAAQARYAGAGGGDGGAAGAGTGGIITAPAPTSTGANLGDLQTSLVDKFKGREGIFGLAGAAPAAGGAARDLFGKELSSGGLWWGTDQTMFDPNAALGRGGRGSRGRGAAVGAVGGVPATGGIDPYLGSAATGGVDPYTGAGGAATGGVDPLTNAMYKKRRVALPFGGIPTGSSTNNPIVDPYAGARG